MNSTCCLYATALMVLILTTTAKAGGITYDCDTAANHFSELSLPFVDGPFTVSGNVKLMSLAGSTKYVPLTRIQIASSAPPGQSPIVYAGFSLSALAVDSKKMPSGETAVQMLSYNLNGQDDEILPFSMMTKPGTVQPFSLSYDGKKVSVNLGNEAKSFALQIAEPVIRIVCSTGEFLFTDLVIRPLK